MGINRHVLPDIIDPGACGLQSAIVQARLLAAEDEWLPERLAELLAHPSHEDTGQTERILNVLAAIADGPRLLRLLEAPMVSDNIKIRSKAWKVYAGATLDPQWAADHLLQSDPRVAANILEAMWRAAPSDELRALFRRGAGLDSNRAAGNAAVGLFLLGDPHFETCVGEMAASPEPMRRASAAWVIGRCGWKQGVDLLMGLSRDPDAKVRQNTLQATRKLVRRWPELRAAG